MKVKLIQATQNPIDVMWTAARTCYSAKSPIEIWSNGRFPNLEENDIQREERLWKLVKKVLGSGHLSVAEHCYFTFAIEGVSRTLLAQLTRHRLCSFSVQSQRYVEIKEACEALGDDGTVINESNYLEKIDLINILDKYFIWEHDNYAQFHSLLQALYCYLYQVQKEDIKPEDARQVLPNCTKTNITMSINLRELIHVSNLRLCSRSQAEIRQLFQAIKKEVEAQDERLASLLVPSCETHGFCTEHQCCSRKPPLNKVLEDYHRYKDLNK